MKKLPDLSIIILNYNTKELLGNCLESIARAEKNGYIWETIVVDNASTDGSVEAILRYKQSLLLRKKDIKILRNKRNLGFTKGNNKGMRAAQGRYLLLLNSDTKVFPKTLVEMIRFMDENPMVGLSTCRVEFTDGRLDPACHRGFPTPWASFTYMVGLEKIFPKVKIFSQYHQFYKDLSTTHEVDSPTGAFSFVRTTVAKQVGYLDEDYFMYGEDLDWAYRIKQAGWLVMYYPKTKIIHYKKQSGRAKTDKGEVNGEIKIIRRDTTNHFYNTMKIFYRKHYAKKYPSIVTGLVLLGIEIKRRLSLARI